MSIYIHFDKHIFTIYILCFCMEWERLRHIHTLCIQTGICVCVYDWWILCCVCAVSHPSTNQARPCLASKIERDRACPGWQRYGRRRCCAPGHLSVSRSVVSDSLRPHGLQPPKLLHLWDSAGQNTGVSCHALLQGDLPEQGLNLGLPHCRQTLYHLNHQRSPMDTYRIHICKCVIIDRERGMCVHELYVHVEDVIYADMSQMYVYITHK